MFPLVAVVALLTTGCVVRERTVYRPAPAAVVATDEVVVEEPLVEAALVPLPVDGVQRLPASVDAHKPVVALRLC